MEDLVTDLLTSAFLCLTPGLRDNYIGVCQLFFVRGFLKP